MLEIRLFVWALQRFFKWAKIPYIHCNFFRVCPPARMALLTVKRSISLLTVLNDDHMNVKVGEELSTSVDATTFFPSC